MNSKTLASEIDEMFLRGLGAINQWPEGVADAVYDMAAKDLANGGAHLAGACRDRHHIGGLTLTHYDRKDLINAINRAAVAMGMDLPFKCARLIPA